MAKLIILSGVAGAGKSTWAAEYVKNNINTVSLNTDALRYELFKAFVLPDDQEKIVQKQIVERAITSAKQNLDVIIDSACVKNKSIIKWVNKLGQYFKEKELVVIDTDLETCLKQNQQRDRHVPDYVIKQMYSYRQNISSDEVLNKVFDNITIVNNQGDR